MSFNFIDRRVPLDIKLKGFFTFTGRQKGTIEKMALKIENMYERYVWIEWSNVLRKLTENRIRAQFYPHKMDVLDDMTKKFTVDRREQVNYTKAFEHIFRMEKMRYNGSNEDYTSWVKQTREIDDFIRTSFASYVNDDAVETFVDKLKQLQKNRLETLVAKMQVRIENSYREEAAEGLLLLRKRENQLREKEEKKKEMQLKKEEEKNNPPPLRRSSRIMKQNK